MIAAVSFTWAGVAYAKGATLPAMSVSQTRHAQRRGYAQASALLVVGKPFTSGGVLQASGAAMPAGLTDSQLRRLIAGRFLI